MLIPRGYRTPRMACSPQQLVYPNKYSGENISKELPVSTIIKQYTLQTCRYTYPGHQLASNLRINGRSLVRKCNTYLEGSTAHRNNQTFLKGRVVIASLDRRIGTTLHTYTIHKYIIYRVLQSTLYTSCTECWYWFSCRYYSEQGLNCNDWEMTR